MLFSSSDNVPVSVAVYAFPGKVLSYCYISILTSFNFEEKKENRIVVLF